MFQPGTRGPLADVTILIAMETGNWEVITQSFMKTFLRFSKFCFYFRGCVFPYWWVMVVVVVGRGLGWLLWGKAQSLTAKKKKKLQRSGLLYDKTTLMKNLFCLRFECSSVTSARCHQRLRLFPLWWSLCKKLLSVTQRPLHLTPLPTKSITSALGRVDFLKGLVGGHFFFWKLSHVCTQIGLINIWF